MGSSLDATGIGLIAQITSADTSKIEMKVSADIHDFYLQSKDGVYTGAADFFISDGTSVAALSVPVQKSEADYKDALSKPFGLTWTVPLTLNGAQVRELRVVVQDHTTGAAGSVRVPVNNP